MKVVLISSVEFLLRALATYRSATSGCDYVESFILLKKVS
jgi:hypothetical protein